MLALLLTLAIFGAGFAAGHFTREAPSRQRRRRFRQVAPRSGAPVQLATWIRCKFGSPILTQIHLIAVTGFPRNCLTRGETYCVLCGRLADEVSLKCSV